MAIGSPTTRCTFPQIWGAEAPLRWSSWETSLHVMRGPAFTTFLDILLRGSLPYVSGARRSIQRRISPFGGATGGPDWVWLVPCSRFLLVGRDRRLAIGRDTELYPRGWHFLLQAPVKGFEVPPPTCGEIRGSQQVWLCRPGRYSGVRSCYWERLVSNGLAASLGRVHMGSWGM